MRSLIAVSSQTGNTYKLSRYAQMGITNSQLQKLPILDFDANSYDLIVIGFFVDKGEIDGEALKFMRKIFNKKTALIATLGGDPKSKSALEIMDKACQILREQNNQVIGTFISQGKVSKKVLNLMYKLNPKLKEDKDHQMRILKASSHPDAKDRLICFLKAQYWFKKACL